MLSRRGSSARVHTRVLSVLTVASAAFVMTGSPAHAVAACHAYDVTTGLPPDFQDVPGPLAGYTVNHAAYTDVEATWRVPFTGVNQNGTMKALVGLNLGTSESHPQITAGTESYYNTAQHHPEAYAYVNIATPSSSQEWLFDIGTDALVRGGETVSAHITENSGGGISVHMHNETNGGDCRIDVVRAGTSPDGHATVGVQRTHYRKQGYDAVPRFDTVTFDNAQVAAPPAPGWIGSMPWKPIGAVSHQAPVLKHGSQVIAKPGSLQDFGKRFSVTSVSTTPFSWTP
jgi:hypothetical protein